MNDDHGQPKSIWLNAAKRADREHDELIGMCKGMVADGLVNQTEAEFLLSWLELNRETQREWPANILYPRIRTMLCDGMFDENEEGELLSLLAKVAGGNPVNLNAHSLSSGLPLDSPQPDVVVCGRRFCFTGKFLYGNRRQCQSEIVSRGGKIGDTSTKDLHYLVIGVIGSRDWIHSTYGRKIQKAVDYRAGGETLAIVSEETFLKSLRRPEI